MYLCWLASLTFRNMMNPHLSWLGTRWVRAAHLCRASRELWRAGHEAVQALPAAHLHRPGPSRAPAHT